MLLISGDAQLLSINRIPNIEIDNSAHFALAIDFFRSDAASIRSKTGPVPIIAITDPTSMAPKPSKPAPLPEEISPNDKISTVIANPNAEMEKTVCDFLPILFEHYPRQDGYWIETFIN